jgi:hypothetical protein
MNFGDSGPMPLVEEEVLNARRAAAGVGAARHLLRALSERCAVWGGMA